MRVFRSKVVLMAVFTGLAFTSCKEKNKPTENKKSETEEVSTKVEIESDPKLEISDYFSGPNFMRQIVSTDNQLNLSAEQEKTFAQWREENHPKIQGKMRSISLLEQEIESLSKNKGSAEKILENLAEASQLRTEIAEIKVLCRNKIIETLNDEQWKTLATGYINNFPFAEQNNMMEVLQHASPVPNYMMVIKSNSSELKLTDSQKSVFDEWSHKNHSKMIEKANQILSLEKEIFSSSLDKEPIEKIMGLVSQIELARNTIVAKKTSCRDLITETLDQEQWAALIDKTNIE